MENEKQKQDIISGIDVRNQLREGLNKTIGAVSSTLGPKGQNVLIDSGHPYAPNSITKDGVTVLKSIDLIDEVENIAVKAIREASEKTVEECGDGTTTTAIIAGEIYNQGLKQLAVGLNSILIKRGMDKLANQLLKKLDEIKVDVTTDEQIRNVATISANGDSQVGLLILEAIEKVGKTGVITVENGKSLEDTLETTEGMKIDKGYASAYFVTNPHKNTCEQQKPMILVTDYEFQTTNDLVPILEMAHAKSRPLFIISEGGSAEALQTLVINKIKGTLNVCAIDAPGFGVRKKENLKDIAAMVGAEFVSEEVGIGIDQVTEEMFGTCEKIITSKTDTTVVNASPKEDVLKERVTSLQAQLEEETVEYDREYLKERIAKLTGGIAVIRVGGASETEVEEKKDRIDDALGATRAAIDGGIVPGGGTAFLHAADRLDMKDLDIQSMDEKAGVTIMLEALKQPLKTIMNNGGENADYIAEIIINNTDKEGYGYNLSNNEYGNLYDMGIIDPVNVTKSALKNAVSVASLLLTSNTIVMKKNQG